MLRTTQWCDANYELFIIESHYDPNDFFLLLFFVDVCFENQIFITAAKGRA